MRITTLFAGLTAAATAVATTAPGYFTNYTTVTNTTFTFGTHFAVLNLDLINGLVESIENTTQGATFINSTATWINAVHDAQQDPPILSLFSRIYVSNILQPEIGPQTPFAAAFVSFPGNGTETDPATAIYPAFSVNSTSDVVVQKSRYYAGFGNQMEEILRAQLIDTVVLSGISTAGVVLSTVYQLFNLDYKVYVIGDNCIQPGDEVGIDRAIKEGIIPFLPADVITLEQALAALQRSGGDQY